MIDLFYPPAIRVRSVTVRHCLDDPDVPWGPLKERRELPRAAYHRNYHTKNREDRLQAMHNRYLANKAEAIAAAKRWKRENPEKHLKIQRENQRRRRIKRILAGKTAHGKPRK